MDETNNTVFSLTSLQILSLIVPEKGVETRFSRAALQLVIISSGLARNFTGFIHGEKFLSEKNAFDRRNLSLQAVH